MTVDLKGRGIPKVDIAGQGLSVITENTVRLKYSNYSFMFNTNHRPSTRSEAASMSDDIETACVRTFSEGSLKGFVRFVNYDKNTKQTSDRNGSWSEIRKAKVRYQVEIGTNRRYGARIHVHGLLQFTHTGNMRLDYAAINNAAKENLTATGCAHTFANMRWKMDKVTQKQYMSKYEVNEDLAQHFADGLKIE